MPITTLMDATLIPISTQKCGNEEAIFWLLALLWLLLMYVLFAGFTLSVDVDKMDVVPLEGNALQVRVVAPLGSLYAAGNASVEPRRSTLTLYEDERPLGPAHVEHKKIRSKGGGAYSHWGEQLIFSTSDNSDPLSNGRHYWYRAHFFVQGPLRSWLLFMAWVLGLLLAAATVGRLRRNGVAVRPLAGVSLLALFGTVLLPDTQGIAFVLLLAITSTAATFVVVSVLFATSSAAVCRKGSRLPANVALLVGSLGLAAVLVEWGVGLVELFRLNQASFVLHRPTPESIERTSAELIPSDVRDRAVKRLKYVTMPEEWERRGVKLPGLRAAYYWHNVLHILNEDAMRRTGGFPRQDPGVFRIMVVGDSLTYGIGVEERWTYPRLLERKLEGKYVVEVLNLGIPGRQSEDVLDVVKRYYDDLQPGLVVYGICLNDFLNSGQGQYATPFFAMPRFLREHSKFPKFLEEKINGMARRLGFSMDFYDDILKDVENYQKRFARDLLDMNAFVRSRGGEPIIAVVLHQIPKYGDRGYRLAKIAERAAQRAGMRVVESEGYFREFDGRKFPVSKWERHPNEIAHAIFAGLLAAEIAHCCGIENYARESAD